jgi:hypothetical protein
VAAELLRAERQEDLARGQAIIGGI